MLSLIWTFLIFFKIAVSIRLRVFGYVHIRFEFKISSIQLQISVIKCNVSAIELKISLSQLGLYLYGYDGFLCICRLSVLSRLGLVCLSVRYYRFVFLFCYKFVFFMFCLSGE